MSDLLERARTATRESKQIEFKSAFDPTSTGGWCEVIKDIVAIANSDGGIIVFGLTDGGTLSEARVDAVGEIDHTDLTNKIAKYTGWIDPAIEIRDIARDGRSLPAFLIQASPTPLAFERPGDYVDGAGKPRSAFAVGTVYFRHGAKSEPGTSADIRFIFDRQLSATRRSWLKQVRRVSRAPLGSQIIISSGASDVRTLKSNVVRVVGNPKATPVILTRGNGDSGGILMHEEISEGIFDEINNVIDADRILSKGHRRFSLDAPTYYRIYAERQNVRQDQVDVGRLLHAAACEFYAPNLYWVGQVSAITIAETIKEIYLEPKNPQVHWLIRLAVLLGSRFSEWLRKKWEEKWQRYTQAPTFYFTSRDMLRAVDEGADRRLVATRSTPTTTVAVPGEQECSYADLIGNYTRASELLSKACLAVFNGNRDLRSTARNLDSLTYGAGLIQRSDEIADAVAECVGTLLPGEAAEQQHLNDDKFAVE